MISREDVEGLAKLARLELGEAEKASLGKDISNILEYVGHVAAVSGAASGPTAPAHHNVMRADTPRPPAQAGEVGDQLAGKEAAIRAAFPKEEKGYNVVRKILQKDE
ncbi:MAG: Asp-tRNA(Asn)/Glu-tRNA(Gln) amidotransferase subunit GatC [bacterium]